MCYIDVETFDVYADIFFDQQPENFTKIHDLLAEPVSKLEKKGYVVAHVKVPAPFPTLYEENSHRDVHKEDSDHAPEHCHSVSEKFRYTTDGDYRLCIWFEDWIMLPGFEPDQWHMDYTAQMLFTIIPSRLTVLDYYAVMLERLRTLYAWVDALPEYYGKGIA